MDAPLPAAVPPAVGFKSLQRLHVKSDDPLPVGPVGVSYGVLENGLQYYVRKNAKPRERAALALGVKVGYVCQSICLLIRTQLLDCIVTPVSVKLGYFFKFCKLMNNNGMHISTDLVSRNGYLS